MTLGERITADLKTAMKAKDQASLRSIRAIKAALLLAQTDGSGEAMTPEKEIKLLQKLVKQRQESHKIFVEQGRTDLATTEAEEIDVIQKYLPAQMSAEEVRAIIDSVIAETGAESMKDMGKVMGMSSKKLAGKADNKLVAEIVKEKLSN